MALDSDLAVEIPSLQTFPIKKAIMGDGGKGADAVDGYILFNHVITGIVA
jgi:hypothetical protein